MVNDAGSRFGRVNAPGPSLLTVGRINLDLYSENVGAPMHEASIFRASVGGSPTNVAIAAARLGTSAAVLTAAGIDPAGDLVVAQLAAAGVETRWVQRLGAGATSMALLATPKPDEGQRQFYRDNPADIHLTDRVVTSLPWHSLRAVLLSADALGRGTTPAVLDAVDAECTQRGIPVWWDLDLRETTWPSVHAYAARVRQALRGADVVLGTEAEFAALLGLGQSRPTPPAVRDLGLPCAIVKTGARGAILCAGNAPPLRVPASNPTPVCTVGGGDALAGGLVHARLGGDEWPDALRFAMHVAGWTVGQPGCSLGFPTSAQLRPAGAPASARSA